MRAPHGHRARKDVTVGFLDVRCFTTITSRRDFDGTTGQLKVARRALDTGVTTLRQRLKYALFMHRIPLRLACTNAIFTQCTRQFHHSHSTLNRRVHSVTNSRTNILHINITCAHDQTVVPPVIGTVRHSYPGVVIRLVRNHGSRVRR